MICYYNSSSKAKVVVMREKLKKRIKREFFWLIGIGVLAALLEYLFIQILDIHPVFTLKIQGFIGLILIAYVVRMVARIWENPEPDTEVNNPS